MNSKTTTIEVLPDELLPSSNHKLEVNLEHNAFTVLNASSIVSAPSGSSMTFDPLSAILATVEERDLLLEKEFIMNIDYVIIIRIIDDPTDP